MADSGIAVDVAAEVRTMRSPKGGKTMLQAPADAWRRLAEIVRERRAELGLRQSDLAERGGPSEGTVKNIEQATRGGYRLPTIHALELSLGWAEGSVQSILAGGESRPPEAPIVDGTDALAAAVLSRRGALGLSQEAVAARGGPSSRMIRLIEKGSAPTTPKTLGRLDTGLGWRPGTCAAILNGAAAEAERSTVADPAAPAADHQAREDDETLLAVRIAGLQAAVAVEPPGAHTSAILARAEGFEHWLTRPGAAR